MSPRLSDNASDVIYQLREWNKQRKFDRLIRQGVEKCEPRFRPILDLSIDYPPGSVEYAHIERYRFAIDHIPKAQGRILNAACGSGYGNAIIAEAGGYPVGVDLFEEPLSIARNRFPFGEYVQADVMQLDRFSPQSLDAVVSFETIEHVRDPMRACSEFLRVLKPGGMFVGSIPIMVFHNPGTNFTWQAALDFVRNMFPDADLYLQDNCSIAPLSLVRWCAIRHQGDKYLLWVWRKVAL